jgi:hypothetical protein
LLSGRFLFCLHCHKKDSQRRSFSHGQCWPFWQEASCQKLWPEGWHVLTCLPRGSRLSFWLFDHLFFFSPYFWNSVKKCDAI